MLAGVFVVFDKGNDLIQFVEAIMRVDFVEGQAFGAEVAEGALRAMEQAHDIARIKPDFGEVGVSKCEVVFTDKTFGNIHLAPPFCGFCLRAFTGIDTTSSSLENGEDWPRIQASISDLWNWSFAPALW